MLKFFLYTVFYGLILYTALLAVAILFQSVFLYFPDRFVYTPEEAGVPEMKVITLTTSDGLTIHSWFRPPIEPQKPTILYLHGNAGNIANRGFIVRPFLDKGFGVLLLTYRGYSGNPGKPSEQGLYNDARAAMQYIEKEGISPKCTVLYGNSIGSAVAIQMASEFSVGALVLQSPFPSIVEVAKFHYPIFAPFLGLLRDKYEVLSKVEKIKTPVLVLQGSEDTIIPPKFGHILIENFSGPKEVITIPQRGHNTLFEPEIVIEYISKIAPC